MHKNLRQLEIALKKSEMNKMQNVKNANDDVFYNNMKSDMCLICKSENFNFLT